MRFRRAIAALACVILPALAQTTAGIEGTVADGRGGEALANVVVQITGQPFRAVTDSTGHFRIDGMPAGDYSIQVSTVGYHLVKKDFHLDPGETKEFEVVLSADTLRQTETVVAQADPFETTHSDAPSTLVLAGNDAKNLGSVLADDPLRAVQSLPGVTANNDFDARFSLRGADYSRVGLYLDGVLLHEPFHTIEGTTVSGSGTAFNTDLVEQMELYEGAFPSRYGDRSAGVLDVETRDGNRSDYTFRAEASMSNAGFLAEGPFGKRHKRGSWLVTARKSYLQYILERTFPDSSLIFGMEDVQGRLNYELTSRQKVTLFVLESYSDLDRSASKSTLGINSLMEAGYHYTLGNAGWQYSPDERVTIKSHLAWMRERDDGSNPSARPLGASYYGEWVWNTDASWMWNSRAPLEAGFSVRQLRQDGSEEQYTNQTALRLTDRFDGNARRTGGYAQQSWLAWSGRLRLNAGARWDQDSLDHIAATSPTVSVSLRVWAGGHLDLGWGQYVQYPDISVLTSILGNRRLPPERSNQAVAAIEQRLGLRTRLRVELYNRADRDMIYQPMYDPRLLWPSLKVFNTPASPLYAASLRGYARGAEVFLQRSSANRFTGWISYAYGHTEDRDGVTGNRFPSDFDQRHTINVYGGYRLKPTVNLSLHSGYGSNFPMPGYFRLVGPAYYLATARNQLRLPYYQRTDFRINKAWTHNRWKMTLYGEVVNLTNHTNYLFDSLGGYNGTTGQASITLDKMFPILPSVGIVMER